MLLTVRTVQAIPSTSTDTLPTELPKPVPVIVTLVVVLGLMYVGVRLVTVGVEPEEY